jgi:tRNA A37 methylthiotransferase MiaB
MAERNVEGMPKLLPYLDIPFQHASPRVLKLMKRPGAVDKTLERIQRWRGTCPDITIRSTFIVGFPGETDAEFEELLDFLDEAQLDRVGAFAYSPVEGAAANALPDPVPEDVKQERLARFMERQAEISEAKLADKVGSVQRCLVDAVDGDLAIARSMADAPEIDGLVQIQNGLEAGLRPGQFVDVENSPLGRVPLVAIHLNMKALFDGDYAFSVKPLVFPDARPNQLNKPIHVDFVVVEPASCKHVATVNPFLRRRDHGVARNDDPVRAQVQTPHVL